MKQKGKSLETTMVCSKRKQKVKNVIEVKDKKGDTNTTTIPQGYVENRIVKISSNEFDNTENNVLIISSQHKSSEKGENVLNEHKITLSTSEANDYTTGNPCNKNEDGPKENISNDFTTETSKINVDENSEKQEAEISERMSSPSSAKSRGNRASCLTTILENAKGEEKEVKRSRINQTKVQADKEIKDALHRDKNSRDDILLDDINKMSGERVVKTPPVIIPDADAVVIKKTQDANDPTRTDDKLTKRKLSTPSLKGEQTVKSSLEPNQRPRSSQSDPGSSRSSIKNRNSNRKIYSGIRFTKQELDYYLPKRSNFSCHEKALRDAGFDLDAVESRRRQRFRRRARVNIDDKEIDEKLKLIEDVNAATEAEVSPDGENEAKEFDEEQSEMERAKLDKSRRKGKKKGDEVEIKVDHTVLLQYLKYVIENQDEYLAHKRQILQQNTSLLNVDPGCSIAKFGRIFQRGQHGTLDETFLLEVTRGIKSNFGESLQWTPPNKDKQMPGLANMKLEPPNLETTIDEKDKTEYEKMKIKLDKWLKTITTAQLLKAKELSLKELGEEDKLQSQWWSALQPCRYLRQRSNLE